MKTFLAVKKTTHILNIIILPILTILHSRMGNTRTDTMAIRALAITNTDTKAMGKTMVIGATIKAAIINITITKEVEMLWEATI